MLIWECECEWAGGGGDSGPMGEFDAPRATASAWRFHSSPPFLSNRDFPMVAGTAGTREKIVLVGWIRGGREGEGGRAIIEIRWDRTLSEFANRCWAIYRVTENGWWDAGRGSVWVAFGLTGSRGMRMLLNRGAETRWVWKCLAKFSRFCPRSNWIL